MESQENRYVSRKSGRFRFRVTINYRVKIRVQDTLRTADDVPLLFTENETNHERLFGQKNESPHVKDGVNDCVVQGKQAAVNPGRRAPRWQRTTRSM
jgi:hypothetical protein